MARTLVGHGGEIFIWLQPDGRRLASGGMIGVHDSGPKERGMIRDLAGSNTD